MIMINIDSRQLNTVIEKRIKNISNATKPLKEIGLRLGDKILETFRLEGSRDGHRPWQELDEDTINAPFRIATSAKERATQKAKGLKITQSKIRKPYAAYKRDDTGKLQRTIISNRRGALNILHPKGSLMKSFKVRKVTSSELVFGSEMKTSGGRYSLGAIHQLGLGHNPVREIIFYTQRDEKEINDVFTRWIVNG